MYIRPIHNFFKNDNICNLQAKLKGEKSRYADFTIKRGRSKCDLPE
jgi:hypothetical protein